MLALAACGPPTPKSTTPVETPVGVQLVVGNPDGVGLFELGGQPIESWSKQPTSAILGALRDHRGVVAMTAAGDVRIVGPREDRVVAKMALGLACGSALAVKLARVSTDGRAACVLLGAPGTGALAVEQTIDLETGKTYAHWISALPGCQLAEAAAPPGIGCPPVVRPLSKSIVIEGEQLTLISVSPTRRWEIYETEAVRIEDGVATASLLFVDTIAKQRYAGDRATWPPTLTPGHKVTGSWPANAQVAWLADDVASIDQATLVQLGKRVSSPGSFVRW